MSNTLEDLELLASEMAQDIFEKGSVSQKDIEKYFLSKLKEAAQMSWSGDYEED